MWIPVHKKANTIKNRACVNFALMERKDKTGQANSFSNRHLLFLANRLNLRKFFNKPICVALAATQSHRKPAKFLRHNK
jgi:hypothetical protein